MLVKHIIQREDNCLTQSRAWSIIFISENRKKTFVFQSLCNAHLDVGLAVDRFRGSLVILLFR